MSATDGLSVCLLIGQTNLQKWFVTALREMENETNANVELVVQVLTHDNANSTERASISSWLASSLLQPIKSGIESVVSGDPQEWISLEKISVINSSRRMQCQSIQDGYRVSIPEKTIDEINRTCDVIIHHSVGILTGDVLSATQYGVLSYHHGDIREYRGGPAGFWEFMHNKKRAGVTLQRLTDQLDAGEIIVEKDVDISDANSWYTIRSRLYSASHDMLKRSVRLQGKYFSPISLPEEELGYLYTSEDRTTIVNLKYILKELQ